MAYMGGGIADMLGAVDKTAGVFAGNPQKLKQKAGPNLSQDLISALALQKITSEKAAAERDMQMQMEQNPATIAEQLEQKATQQSQQEIAKQVGQIGQQKQQRQQSAMQKLAGQMSKPKPMNMQGQQRPQAQQRPQGTGIAQPPRPMAQRMGQGLPQAPRQPMTRLMSGGIVGFNKGKKVSKDKFGFPYLSGEVSPEDITAEEIAYRRRQMGPGYKLSDEEVRRDIAYNKNRKRDAGLDRQIRRESRIDPVYDPETGQLDMAATAAKRQAEKDRLRVEQYGMSAKDYAEQQGLRPDAEARANLTGGMSAGPAQPPQVTIGDSAPAGLMSPAANPARTIDDLVNNTGGTPAATATPPPSAGGLENLTQQGLLADNQAYQKLLGTDLTPQKPTYGQTADAARDEALTAAGLLSIDAQGKKVNPQNPQGLTDVARRAAEEKRVQEMMGLENIKEQYDKNRAAREKILAERDDPERLKNIAFRQGLQGFKNRGVGGYAAGRDAAEGAQFAGRLKGREGLEALDKNFATNRIDIGKEAAASGRTQQIATDADRQTIMTAFKDASAEEVRRAELDAEIVNKGMENNLSKLETLTGIESDAQSTAATRGNKIAELNQKQVTEANKLMQTIKKDAMALAQKTVQERENNGAFGTEGLSRTDFDDNVERLFLAFYAQHVATDEALKARMKQLQSNIGLNNQDFNDRYIKDDK